MKQHTRPRNIPLAYLITFCTYGHRLPGSAAGSVNRFLNEHGTPGLPLSPELEEQCRRRMKQSAYELDRGRRNHVRAAIIEACRFRGWELLVLHVRTTHMHSVVQSDCHPDFVSEKMKDRSSRRLNEAQLDFPGRRRWEPHGSTNYLWKPESVYNAIEYVIQRQGGAMSVYINWNHPAVQLLKLLGKL